MKIHHVFLALLIVGRFAGAETVFTFRPPESGLDPRAQYSTAVFTLALEKTRASFGDYRVELSPVMNSARAVYVAKADDYPNFFLKASYDQQLELDGLAYVPFPVDLGIVGYRVCFVSELIKEQVEAALSFDELKQFSHGQGVGWADVDILRDNGMQVIEISNYESLFQMVAMNRFDLFCRGASELFSEYQSHSHITNLSYDTSMVIAYPLPRFFYTNKSNQKAIARLQAGLTMAYEDGSLQELWRRFYLPNVNFANLPMRKIYRLKNPKVESLDFNYQRYFFDPFAPTGNPSP